MKTIKRLCMKNGIASAIVCALAVFAMLLLETARRGGLSETSSPQTS